MLKSCMDLNSKIEYIDDSDPGCYSINLGEILIVTSGSGGVGSFIMKCLSGNKPKRVMVLGRVLNGNDQEKVNFSIHLRGAGIDFKTV